MKIEIEICEKVKHLLDLACGDDLKTRSRFIESLILNEGTQRLIRVDVNLTFFKKYNQTYIGLHRLTDKDMLRNAIKYNMHSYAPSMDPTLLETQKILEGTIQKETKK